MKAETEKLSDIDVRFGKKLRILRKKADMGQVELGKLLGYTSTGTISQIETGIRGMGKEKIVEVAKIFGVDPSYLTMDSECDDTEIEMAMAFYKYMKMPKEKRPATFEAVKQLLDSMK